MLRGTPSPYTLRQEADVQGMVMSRVLKSKAMDVTCNIESFPGVYQTLMKREGKAPGWGCYGSFEEISMRTYAKCVILAQSDGEQRATPMIEGMTSSRCHKAGKQKFDVPVTGLQWQSPFGHS